MPGLFWLFSSFSALDANNTILSQPVSPDQIRTVKIFVEIDNKVQSPPLFTVESTFEIKAK